MLTFKPGEEIIRETKPHSASFLGSPNFWAGMLIFLFGVLWGFRLDDILVSFVLSVMGFLLIGFSYVRRVGGYKFYLTNQRIISNYRCIV